MHIPSLKDSHLFEAKLQSPSLPKSVTKQRKKMLEITMEAVSAHSHFAECVQVEIIPTCTKRLALFKINKLMAYKDIDHDR